jgi:hypothetical protein
MFIFRRSNCIVTASGNVTLRKELFGASVESGLQNIHTKFRANLSSGSRVLPCGRTYGRTNRRNTDRRTDMTKLMVSFRNFAKAPKNCYIIAGVVIVVLKNCIKIKLHCLIQNCYIILVLCFNKWPFISFGKLQFKYSPSTRSKSHTQLHYAHLQITSRRLIKAIIYLLALDETDIFSSRRLGN